MLFPDHCILRKVCVFLGVLAYVWVPACAQAELSSPETLKYYINRMEENRRHWIAINANLILEFATPDKKIASCHGELRYERLSEKLLLKCLNDGDQLLFIFKSWDRDFELYIPARETLFRGNIFQLQDSPEIESHLSALDLYRALKPVAIPYENSEIETISEHLVTLNVYARRPGENRHLYRRVSMTKTGHVVQEKYYANDETPTVSIHRGKFQIVDDPATKTQEAILFPHTILIESMEKPITTSLVFDHLEFPAGFSSEDWLFPIPEGTATTEL
ncbi:MAG: hypothetical protein Q8R76_11540 [Candidatus Omnitrophota bacterium]|nr:hypothetical protein [Candidatus Omnitrophota bacterium]